MLALYFFLSPAVAPLIFKF